MTRYLLYNGQTGSNSYQIGAATSTNGRVWTKHPGNPVITPGTAGQWDDDHLKDVCLVWDGAQYVAFYAGHDGTNYRIGRATATSVVGTWTKYGSNPVITLGAGGSVDEGGAAFPSVLYEPDDVGREWKMWYRGQNGAGVQTVCYAYSSDGLTWTKYGRVIDVGTSGGWYDEGVLPGAIVKVGTQYNLFVGGRQGTTNPRWQGGLFTFYDPEGTYTADAGNPIVLARFNDSGTSLTPSATVNATDTTITFTNSSTLLVGEPIVLADGDSESEVFYIVANSGTVITLDRAVVGTFNAANGFVVRSFMYNSVHPRAVIKEGSQWWAYCSTFQALEGLTPGGTKLREGSIRYVASDLSGPWTPTFDTPGLLFPLRAPGATWDSISAENPVVFNADTDIPVPGFWVDWDRDGFGAGGTGTPNSLPRMLPHAASSSAYDEITADVLRATWRRGASLDHVSSPSAGGGVITVKNSTGKYNPDNSSSVLYGKLVPGLPVWAGALRDTAGLSGTGTVRGILAGRVTEIVPTPVPGANPSADILFEDALGSYRRARASVSPSMSRSHGDFRVAVLEAAGEDPGRIFLDIESGMLPFSAADTREALGLLDELNKATATRHWVAPADQKEDWYRYSTAAKTYKLAASTDASIDGDDVAEVAGYRVTNDTIINEQRATVSPIEFSPVNAIQWTYGQPPLTVTSAANMTIWADFDDYVFDASITANSTGGTLTATLVNFGRTAKVVLQVIGAPAIITSLYISGRLLEHLDNETVVSNELLTIASQNRYGVQSGSDISSDFIGQTGAAQGVVDFIAWKFREPLKRPSMQIVGKSAGTLNNILDLDLFDLVSLTVDRLNVTSRRFEVIGLSGSVVPGREWRVNYELQETPNQSALDYFTVNEDSVNGSQLTAPF